MHFLVEEAWELRDPIQKAFVGNQSHLYPCVELDFNRPLWHLDIRVTHGSVVAWRRFIFSSVARLVATLREHQLDATLHFQSAMTGDAEPLSPYEIWPVKALSEGRDLVGRVVYVIDLGSRRFLYPKPSSSVPALTELQCIYSDSRA